MVGSHRKFMRKKHHYVFVFLLVVIQGFAGWYMVKSGLVDRVDVSHYRLAIHLILAVLLFSYLWWIYLSIINRNIKTLGNKRLYNLLWNFLQQ